MRKFALTLALITLPVLAQQAKQPRVSPDQTLKQTVGLTDITVDYSRQSYSGSNTKPDSSEFGAAYLGYMYRR